jgi:U6 snRNA-associated Sm-like protein LSm8
MCEIDFIPRAMTTSTAQLLEQYSNQRVLVLTMDGRIFIGVVKGFDQQCNLILTKCSERIFSTNEGVESMEHGMYIVRGDNVASIGEIDDDIDAAVNWEEIRAEPLNTIRY